MSARLVGSLLVLAALLAGCNSLGVGVNIPIGRGGSIGVGGSIPLPRPSSPPASAPEATASAPTR